MLIGGIQKTTLIDYPDKIAATIFTIGCNFRCSFCHNPEIVKGVAKVIPEDQLWDLLDKRKKITDAVCITGGEPTLQKDLKQFITKIKKMGFLVKLDTNGTHPEVIEDLIKHKLIDYIAMDIKAPWDKYQKVTVKKINIQKIKDSVKLIRDSKLPHEFRSTVLPALHSEEDILKMARQVKGAEKYYLQPFRSRDNLMDEKMIKALTYSRKQLNDIVEQIKDWFQVCGIR